MLGEVVSQQRQQDVRDFTVVGAFDGIKVGVTEGSTVGLSVGSWEQRNL
jgi:hypothetical protein